MGNMLHNRCGGHELAQMPTESAPALAAAQNTQTLFACCSKTPQMVIVSHPLTNHSGPLFSFGRPNSLDTRWVPGVQIVGASAGSHSGWRAISNACKTCSSSRCCAWHVGQGLFGLDMADSKEPHDSDSLASPALWRQHSNASLGSSRLPQRRYMAYSNAIAVADTLTWC